MDWIQQLDVNIFLFFNGIHSSFFDILMYWVSQTVVWIPLWIFFIYLIIKQHKTTGWWLVLAMIAAVALADLASVHLFKNVFMRLRPCHNPEISHLVHIVNEHCGGQYGFVSSHSANMFAIATFMFLALRKMYRLSWIPLFGWAAIIAYSRVYLGVHYPGDILGGALLGSGVSILVWWVYSKVKKE
jgi:undecaprenyl-diphosphatase